MHCLLCHEKIPRLRVWRTKSEFCCEEHAALYKKQTLERLLADQSTGQNGSQAPLPEPPEPLEFEAEDSDSGAEQTPAELRDDMELWERFDRDKQAREESVELPPPADEEQEGEGPDEIWRLAEEVGEGVAGHAAEGGGAVDQSAEDALDALRRLASEAREAGETRESHPKAFEMPGLQDGPDTPAEELDSASAASDESASWGGTSLGDLEESSILDELLADPPASWEREQAKGESEPAGAKENVDLEAPEPDWEFADASSELSALKASLAGTGAPPVTPDASAQESDVDISPDEPDWEELEALDLSDAQIDPPEPLAEDEPRTADDPGTPSFATAQEHAERDEPEVAAARNGAVPAAPEVVQQRAAGRFKPVLTFVEIQLDLATSPAPSEPLTVETESGVIASSLERLPCHVPAGPQALGPDGSRIQGRDSTLETPEQPLNVKGGEAVEPPGGHDITTPSTDIFLPGGMISSAGQSSELAMHQGSVDIQPAGSFDELPEGDVDFDLSEAIENPCAPEGLFFDTAEEEAGLSSSEDGAAAEAVAGSRSELS